MSWNGTVRCSYCYQSKHNRATCPTLLENMTKRREGNPEDYLARRYFDKRSSQQRRTKTCGWCEHSGHTRRTCKELLNAKKVAVELCAGWRQRFVAEMKKTGLGVGALVQMGSDSVYLGVLTGINWCNLDHRIAYGRGTSGSQALIVHPVADVLGTRGHRVVSIPNFEGLVSDYRINHGYGSRPTSIIGPINQMDIEKQIPSDFLDGTTCIESIFQETAKSQDRPASWQVEDWCELVGFYDN